VISQTTLSLGRRSLDGRCPRAAVRYAQRPAADDICYATQNRQDAVKRLAEEATLILVIGSETSSNAQRLVEVARIAGAAAS
jgi:4-hydroxy-3-methylbut-2-enyl diphosphate reductase